MRHDSPYRLSTVWRHLCGIKVGVLLRVGAAFLTVAAGFASCGPTPPRRWIAAVGWLTDIGVSDGGLKAVPIQFAIFGVNEPSLTVRRAELLFDSRVVSKDIAPSVAESRLAPGVLEYRLGLTLRVKRSVDRILRLRIATGQWVHSFTWGTMALAGLGASTGRLVPLAGNAGGQGSRLGAHRYVEVLRNTTTKSVRLVGLHQAVGGLVPTTTPRAVQGNRLSSLLDAAPGQFPAAVILQSRPLGAYVVRPGATVTVFTRLGVPRSVQNLVVAPILTTQSSGIADRQVLPQASWLTDLRPTPAQSAVAGGVVFH